MPKPSFKYLLIFFFFTKFVFAADSNPANLYLVEDVAVNVNGKTPSAARNAAVATAHRDAFLILLTRLELNANIADNVSDDEISDMVRSEQINNEKIAGSNYSATFNIMFAKNFVDHILSQKNPKNTEDKASKTTDETRLLIPVKTLKRRVMLWEESNDWKKAIEKNLSKKSQTKFIVPDSDVDNIGILNRDNVATADYSSLEPLLLRYKADAAYTLFFSYDEIENKVSIDVFYIRKLQKKQIKLSFINVDRLNYESLLDKVAEKSIDYLINSQSGEGKNLNSNLIRFGIHIRNFSDWLMMKSKIENSNLVNQLNIESISYDYAVVSVNYIDATTDITEAFSRIGISLDKKSENFYTLNAN